LHSEVDICKHFSMPINILLLKLNYRHHRQKNSLSPTEINSTEDDFWASDESFEALINDEEVSDEKMESYFHDDGEGTWPLFDGLSHT
jgi:hypothetical protein